jgi:NDP-sugar pyrophosphorylase family protein
MRNAVILAAGKGTRLKAVTGDLPKPMLPLHGRPLLDHVLDRLRAAGLERFVLVTGHGREAIERHYAGDASVSFAYQEKPDGTGSAALAARAAIGEAPFLLCFADVLADPEAIRRMCGRLGADPLAAAILAVVHCDDPYQGAAVYEREGVLDRIVEKPPRGASATNWNSAGLFAFRPPIFETLARLPLSRRGEYELTEVFDILLAEGRRVLVEPLSGDWRDVGRPEDIAPAERITTRRPPRG